MSIQAQCLSPSSSLPKLRSLHSLSESELKNALLNLQTIYCPLRLPINLIRPSNSIHLQTDSGYASDIESNEETLSILRLDEFERSCAVRWLISLISRVEALSFADEVKNNIIDEASFILSSFSDAHGEGAEEALIRTFSFQCCLPSVTRGMINVQLNDEPLSGTDHTDVGLQTWGASIIFSGLLCSMPERLGITDLPSDAKLVELGAGTGLISLTLAKLFAFLPITNPSITATDYHPAVLDNLRENIASNFYSDASDLWPVETETLNWKTPPEPLRSYAHMIFAADVVYAPEHAAWLRHCAEHILAPDGIFWLIVTVRTSGKFADIPDTAEAAFRENEHSQNQNGQRLKILEKETLDQKPGIGRGDENGYLLFKIGWSFA